MEGPLDRHRSLRGVRDTRLGAVAAIQELHEVTLHHKVLNSLATRLLSFLFLPHAGSRPEA